MTTITTSTGFVIERRFDARVEEVWRAWTDPDEAQHWWHPRGMHTPRETIEFDLRPGGRYRYTMVDDGTGEEYPTGGVYLEVTPPSRLVFSWGYPDADANESPLITVNLSPDGDRCLMRFEMSRLPDGTHPGVTQGWEGAVGVLADHMAGGR